MAEFGPDQWLVKSYIGLTAIPMPSVGVGKLESETDEQVYWERALHMSSTAPENTHAFVLDPLLEFEALGCCPYLRSISANFDLFVTSAENRA